MKLLSHMQLTSENTASQLVVIPVTIETKNERDGIIVRNVDISHNIDPMLVDL